MIKNYQKSQKPKKTIMSDGGDCIAAGDGGDCAADFWPVVCL